MGQGGILTFKAYLLMWTLGQAVDTITWAHVTLAELWEKCIIKYAIENTGALLQEVKVGNIFAVWQRLWPHCANNSAGLKSHVNEVKIVACGNVDWLWF